LPAFCAYQPRCRFAQAQCREGIPEARDLGRSKVACYRAHAGEL
jgi:ABC-type dipeptide/oligopeptide/nickel transport system ATPase component